MKIIRLFVLGVFGFSTAGFSVTLAELEKRAGIYHKIGEASPFSGHVLGQDNGRMVSGRKNGEWTYRYENGQIKNIGSYENGSRAGTWLGYYESGNLFYEGAYLKGKKHGQWISYYDDRTLFYRGTYKAGKEHGEWIAFNPDGTPWVYRTGRFSQGYKVSE